VTRLRVLARSYLRLGNHSRRMGSWSVWEILLASPATDTGYIPRPAGRHRLEAVA
jgi:hypothetical protein